MGGKKGDKVWEERRGKRKFGGKKEEQDMGAREEGRKIGWKERRTR